ncbi:FAS1 domain-containing protein [Pilobolus umbonatus]|nr:FAS1 domain-containing protein [Pilobolus umbonatus]
MTLVRLLLFIISILVINTLGYKTIIDALSEDDRFQSLIAHIQHNRLTQYMNSLETATFFAPDNDAFDQTGIEITKDILLYHLLGDKYTVDNLHQGQLMESKYIREGYLDDRPQRVKVAVERNKVRINQADIIQKDIIVNNNTIIHMVNRVLEPPQLLGDSTQRNRMAYDLMQLSHITDLLNTPKPYTVFITSKLNPLEYYNTLETTYLTSVYGQQDLSAFFKYSIVQSPVYLDELEPGTTMTLQSIAGDPLTLTKSKDGKCTLNNIQITQSDILAANGVIQEIKDTFRPTSIQFNARKYLYAANATRFVELLDGYRLGEIIDQLTANYTFLAPHNEAIPTNSSLFSKSWIRYHVINGSWTPDQLYDGMLLETESKPTSMNGAHQRLPVSIENGQKITTMSKSIHFDRARVTGDPINIFDSVIYQITEPLSLPGDILHELVLDLDLSTFIATLYVSEVADEIKATPGLTLFVPTNEAFQNMGLVAKYLVHPTAKEHLQTVLRYHASQTLLYHNDMRTNITYSLTTLANSTLTVYPENTEGKVLVGRPGDSDALIIEFDTLVSNGVIHKISEVQVPEEVKITNHHLLTGIEAATMIRILDKANLLTTINEKNMVVLAPTEKAFSQIDLESLFNDPYELERLARLHIIPRQWQDRWIEEVNHHEYPTLLSEVDKVYIKENEKGELYIEVKDGGEESRAHVLGLGRVSAGGGVISIDAALLPVRRGFFGLPWMWSIVVTLIILVASTGTLGVCGFFGYKIFNRRRLGYRPISE